MKITVSLDTQAVITQPSPLRFKAGCFNPVEIGFIRGSQSVPLPDGAVIEFALKPKNQWTGGLLAYLNAFSIAAGNLYTGTLNCAAAALLTALGLSDDVPANDVAQIDASAEVTWSFGGQKFRSTTFSVTIESPLTDDLPVATPDPELYPTPSEVARKSDIAALGTAARLDAGTPNGTATLDGSGKLAGAQVPDAVALKADLKPTGSNRIVIANRFALAFLPTADVNGNPITMVNVGDVVHQIGTQGSSRTAVLNFSEHSITDDDINNGSGVRFFDENGTNAGIYISDFGGTGTVIAPNDFAYALSNAINSYGLNAYANVTGDGQVTITSYTSGPLPGSWSFSQDAEVASYSETEGTAYLPPGDFIVVNLSSLGDATGFQGIGDTVDFLSGYGAPTADVGEEGNGYVDQNNGDFYHRDASGWNFVLNIKGPQGEQGQQGPQGDQGPQGNPGNDGSDFIRPIGLNLKRIALKLPPYAYPTYVLSGASSLRGICFDGSYVWVADMVNIYKVNISDGSVAATYTPYVYFWFLVSDGTYIWACPSGGNLYRINPSTGVATSYSIGIDANRACCDGTYVYAVGDSNASVVKVKASDGSIVGTYTIPNGTHDVCFDGTYLWIACGSGSLVKMRASDGTTMATYPIANMPYRVCFDGTSIWVGTWIDTSLSKVRMSDGAVLGCYNMGARPIGLVFDGFFIWYLCGSSAMQIRPRNGAMVSSYATGATAGNGVYDGCFDGSSLWLSNYNSANVGRL